MVKRIFLILLVLLAADVSLVLALRWVDPPETMFMLTSPVQPAYQNWVPATRISREMALAVIASEDQRFPDHHGFDFNAIENAADYNTRHRHHMRGASTISQQTAKNLFLWRSRSWLRKGLEAYFTLQLEALWDKRRILEVYLNVAQFGPNIYGAEAAARHYFHKHAAQLTAREAASLAAILPDPDHWRPDPRSARAAEIAAQMRNLGPAMVSQLK